eukprot:scaffold6002_cov110-Isochrysis_galbana.AAC.8
MFAESFKIEIPVDEALLPESRTPDSLAAEKHSSLSTPRVPKSPSELRKAEELASLLRKCHVEAVQARAARENQRADEAKARRLRAAANSRQRLQARFDDVAKRDALQDEQKKAAAEAKALLRTHRAEEARHARLAMQSARIQKLESAAERVEESARRAANIVQATAAKNALLAKHALAVVVAHREQQREQVEAAACKLTTKVAAATERRNDAIEQAMPSSARMEMAKAELASLEMDRQLKKLELDRSIAAATQRRESNLKSRVEKARGDLWRVQAVHHAKAMMAVEAEEALAESRRAIFAKLNAADVRAKVHLSRKASCSRVPEPLVFEVPAREVGARVAQLPAALVERLQAKARASRMISGTDLLTRKAVSAAARLSFALKGALSAAAAAKTREARAAALKAAVHERTRSGCARALHFTRARAAAAKHMNGRVAAASVRRATTMADKQKGLAKRALRNDAAGGRRAVRLLALSSNSDEATRHAMFLARRSTMDAEREGRGVSLRLRCLIASMKVSESLVNKSAHAHTFSLPYSQIRAKLTPAKKQPEKSVAASRPTPLDSVGICGRSPSAARSKPDVPPAPVASNMGGFVGRSPQGMRPTRASSSESNAEEWVKVA